MTFKNSISKMETLSLNAITLLIFNVIFLICNVYPKHIIELKNIHSIFAIILNLVFYFLYFTFLNIAFNDMHFLSEDFAINFEPFTKKIHLSRTWNLLLAQIIIDITKLLICDIVKSYSYFVMDAITMINWLVIYFIIVKKDKNVFIKRNCSILISISLILVFTVTFILDANLLKKYIELTDKFQYDSIILQNGVSNCDFLFTIKNFVFDFLIGIIILFFHYLYNKNQNDPKNHSKGKIPKFLVKLFVLVFISIIIIFLKTICFPYSSIKGISVNRDSESVYINDEKFYANTEILSIERVGTNRISETVFSTTKDIILYKGKVIKEFYSNDSQKARNFERDGNQIVVSSIFDERTVLGTKVQIYKDQIFCFVQDNVPLAIHVKEINNYSENKIILEICKRLISEGDVGVFEYCCLYLYKYDPEFINPYINRYIDCEFTDEELKSLNYHKIKKEYIVNLAKETRKHKGTVL